MAHYTCHPRSTSHPFLSESQAAVGIPPHALTWNQKKKATLPGRFTLQRNSGGVGMLLSRHFAVYILSCGDCLSDSSCCFPGHWAQGIYTKLVSSILEDLPRVEGPPCSDVIFNDGCHVLRGRTVTVKWQASLSPPSPLSSSGALHLYGAAAARGFLSHSLWMTFS